MPSTTSGPIRNGGSSGSRFPDFYGRERRRMEAAGAAAARKEAKAERRREGVRESCRTPAMLMLPRPNGVSLAQLDAANAERERLAKDAPVESGSDDEALDALGNPVSWDAPRCRCGEFKTEMGGVFVCFSC